MRSMRSAPLVACWARSGRRRLEPAASVRPCRRWWPRGKERSTRSARDWPSCATCWSRPREPLRSELRPLTQAPLLRRLAATRPERRRDPELRGCMLALRSVARRVLQLQAEERELGRQIEALTRKLAPQLLDQPGVGPHAAAQLVLSWSHPGRIRSEAAFARLAGAAPIPASSGQTIRHRLDRSGDRKLNRALHLILVTRKRTHPPTIAYIERRIQEGKTRREANRCLKRYLARNLYRLLEHEPPIAT